MSEQELDQGRMTLIEHLTELRSRLIKCAVAVAIGAVVCWFAYPWILDQLIQPYCDLFGEDDVSPFATETTGECPLLQTNPLEGFSVRMTIAGYGGLALAIPVILWQLWAFITPGLYAHEKRYAAPFVIVGAFLFLLGGGLAYWSIPRALSFLADIGGPNLIQAFSPGPYLGFVVKMIVAFGIGFEFPLLLVFLQMIGLVHNETLRRGRRFAAVGIVVLAAVITPSGDPFTLLVMSVPLYLLYEGAIIFGRLRERRRRKRSAASPPASP